MSTHTGVIDATVDLGSNSTEITVARMVDDTIEVVAHESTMIRLGESVNTTGTITPEKQDAVIKTLQHYQQFAQEHEVSSITVIATEAVRKAENCEAFLDAVQQETGLTVHTVSGEMEARLTYLGATSDHQELADAGVIDVGGGSTELIIAQQGHIQWLTSLPIGAGWLHDHYLLSDPPTAVEVDKARTFLNTYLSKLQLPETSSAQQAHRSLIATGTSAKILLKLSKQVLHVNKKSDILSRYDLLGCFGLLSALPAAEIARRYELPLERAHVLPGGTLILLALLDFLQLEEISVSQRGVSEGALLAAPRYGDSWTEEPDLKGDTAHISEPPPVQDVDQSTKPATESEQQSEQFAETGRQELLKRGETFVKWIDPVLENTDIESVHKMRVASRRLRATLDAYESACARKPFKQVYQEVKQAADLLGTARDTDVMIQHLEQLQQEVPDNERSGIQWLTSRLQSFRQQEQQAMAAFFEDFPSKRFQRSVAACMPKGGPNRGKN